jgi:hypothetical protein
MGAGAVLIGVVVLFAGRRTLQGHRHVAGSAEQEQEDQAELLAIGDLD